MENLIYKSPRYKKMLKRMTKAATAKRQKRSGWFERRLPDHPIYGEDFITDRDNWNFKIADQMIKELFTKAGSLGGYDIYPLKSNPHMSPVEQVKFNVAYQAVGGSSSIFSHGKVLWLIKQEVSNGHA